MLMSKSDYSDQYENSFEIPDYKTRIRALAAGSQMSRPNLVITRPEQLNNNLLRIIEELHRFWGWEFERRIDSVLFFTKKGGGGQHGGEWVDQWACTLDEAVERLIKHQDARIMAFGPRTAEESLMDDLMGNLTKAFAQQVTEEMDKAILGG